MTLIALKNHAEVDSAAAIKLVAIQLLRLRTSVKECNAKIQNNAL
jgi:hypothetical protein